MTRRGDKSDAPRILTQQEIDLMLDGDRRQVDRVMLTQINDLARAFITFKYDEFPEHAEKEDEILDAIGRDPQKIRARGEFVDTLIERQRNRNRMMQKVSEGFALWAVILFAVFLLAVFKDSLVNFIQDVSVARQAKP